MEIDKYIKKGNSNYQVIFKNGEKISLNEDVILKYNLLYKKDIDSYLLEEIIKDNNNYDIYNKCVKYISVRLRSINEIREFMIRKGISEEVIENTTDRLIKNRLLDDEVFTKAFVKDKMNFTSMGPYMIEAELKKHKIDANIINKYINSIEKDILNIKINKQIDKIIRSNHNKNNLRNKVYINLVRLGYSKEMIIDNINKYGL